MLDGSVRQGVLDASRKEDGTFFAVADANTGGGEQLYFESENGEHNFSVNLNSVKAIYIGSDVADDTQDSPRFFDSAAIPASLWVRAVLDDGQIVEGMIANAWSALTGSILQLHLPGHESNHRQVLIPRSSIVQFQVITVRK